MLTETDMLFNVPQIAYQVVPNQRAQHSFLKIQQVIQQTLKKNPSYKTIFSLSTNMMGTSIIIFPVLFKQMGIITAVIIETIMFLITARTCQLYTLHIRPHEKDFPVALLRIMGQNHFKGYCAVNTILLAFIGVILYLLIVNLFYPISALILQNNFGVQTAFQTEWTFSHYSLQWCGVFIAMLCFCLYCTKDIAFMSKLSQYGFLSIIFVFIYTMIKGGENYENISKLGEKQAPLFTNEFITLAGVFLVSFQVHQVTVPILKLNKDQHRNLIDILLAYFIAFLVYIMVGIVGTIALLDKAPTEGSKGETILEYYPKTDILSLFVQVFLMLQLFSVIPILSYASRGNLFLLIYGKKEEPKFVFHLFNILFSAFSLAILLGKVNINTAIAVTGSVVSFFSVFYFPCVCRIKVLYYGEKHIDIQNTYNLIENQSKQVIEKQQEQLLSKTNSADKIKKKNLQKEDHESANSKKNQINNRLRKKSLSKKIPNNKQNSLKKMFKEDGEDGDIDKNNNNDDQFNNNVMDEHIKQQNKHQINEIISSTDNLNFNQIQNIQYHQNDLGAKNFRKESNQVSDGKSTSSYHSKFQIKSNKKLLLKNNGNTQLQSDQKYIDKEIQKFQDLKNDLDKGNNSASSNEFEPHIITFSMKLEIIICIFFMLIGLFVGTTMLLSLFKIVI